MSRESWPRSVTSSKPARRVAIPSTGLELSLPADRPSIRARHGRCASQPSRSRRNLYVESGQEVPHPDAARPAVGCRSGRRHRASVPRCEPRWRAHQGRACELPRACVSRCMSRHRRKGRPEHGVSAQRRSAITRAESTQACRDASASGTSGTTSMAPTRGCRPRCVDRSIRSTRAEPATRPKPLGARAEPRT